jgi:hypothetical protein
MRLRRRLPIILGVLLVAAALVLIVQLRRHAPPEPARLLPTADGFVYVNLGWMRRVNIVDQLPPVAHDPDYEQFIQQTGFQFERDLNRAAFAIHYPSLAAGNSGPFKELRFSEVLEGRIETDKLISYLRKMAQTVDKYRSVDIYSIPLEGRILRVAILGVDTVAASNHDDPTVIRGIIDRSRKLASPFGGPAFLRQYYKQVPLASLAWAILRVENSDRQVPLANGIWSLLFPRPATVVASARYLRAVHLKAEAFATSQADAQSITQQASAFLSVFHGAETSASAHGVDPDVKEFFDSLKVEQNDDRAVLTATLPPGFIKKVFTEPPPAVQQNGGGTRGNSPLVHGPKDKHR